MLSDGEVSKVYFNEETNIDRIDSLLQERNASQVMPKLETVCKIGPLKHQAMVFACEVNFGNLSFFDEPRETPID